MDLAGILPALLPAAVAWAMLQERAAISGGEPLTPDGLRIARRAGVLVPGRIRVRTVDALPVPDDPELREAAIRAGLIAPGMVGLTLGYGIFVRRGHADRRLLSHECRHVQQYEAHGGIAGFLPVYLAQVARDGYADAAFEIDARDHERDSG